MADDNNPRRLTFLDRAVAFFSPGAALERVVDRTRLQEFSSVYESARTSTRRGSSGGVSANSVSESWAANRDRVKLIWDARHAARNIPFIRGYLEKERMYVCNNIEYHADTGESNIDTIYQDYFHDWCGRADLTERMRFSAMVEVLYGSFRCDGDSGFNIVRDKRSREPRLQLIESDRLGSPYETVENPRYFAGVIVDENGKPIAYRVFARTKSGQYVNPQEIPASRFIHLIRRERWDQYRGVTPLASVLPKARDLHEWMGITMQAGKTAAMWAAFVKSSDPTAAKGAVAWKDSDVPGMPRTAPAIPGMITKLGIGEEIVFPPGTTQPSGQFMAYVQAVVREMAIGLNRPYGFVYNMAELGGVTARIELMQAHRGIQRDQTLLKDLVLERVKNEVLAAGIAMRKLPPHPRWRRGRWTFGAWITGDVDYQTNSDIELVKMGVKPISALAAQLDYDMMETARQNAGTINDLRDVAEDTGTVIELLAPDWLPEATALLAAANSPPQPPPPPPQGLIEENEGDAKSVGPLIDILEKVSTSKMERTAGVLAVQAAYGWDMARCEAIVPQPLPPPLPPQGEGGNPDAQ